jgi:hypothetical protein
MGGTPLTPSTPPPTAIHETLNEDWTPSSPSSWKHTQIEAWSVQYTRMVLCMNDKESFYCTKNGIAQRTLQRTVTSRINFYAEQHLGPPLVKACVNLRSLFQKMAGSFILTYFVFLLYRLGLQDLFPSNYLTR